ncbi:hypothetical protein KJ996_03600, partial [Patescibacteria group bacterium]|nr:hypothetical protein [Patescibacteria group bacterium]
MSVHKHSLRSVSEMHAFLAGGGSEMPVVWGREERAEFIGEVLSAVGYERLPREAKGVVRQYLQVASGYSRAQVARTIAMHRQKGFRETVQKGVKLVIPKSVIPAGLLACFLLLMTSASFRSPEAALQFLNGDSINVWNMSKKFADSLPMDRSLLAQVSSVETVMPDGTRGDLFVVQKEVWPEGYHRLAEQHLIAETPQKLEEKVENRRETRLQNLWARLIGKDLEANTEQRRQQRLLVQDESGQIHAAAEPGVITQTMTVSGGPVNIWDLLGSGREGEVLMVKDGRPAWGSPALPTVGNPEMGAGRVPPEVSRGGGGSGGGRSYGGGNTAATATTTTTNITQNVTQTVSDSDWTASGTDIYSAVSGNVGIGTSVPSVKLEVVGTASGRIFHAQDQLTTSGALIVEEGQTIRLNGVSYLFPGSDGTSSGQVLATDASGTLSWTTQSASSSFSSGNVLTLLGSDANPRYVQIAGDTMTGALVLQGGTLTATGVNVTANLAASGTLSVDGAVTFDSTLTLNNVSYTFPYSDGTGSGKVLKTDGAGNLVWGTDANDSGIGISQNSGDARYVNVSGDTMTGALVIQGANLIASGAIITGNLAASGSLSIDGLTYLNSNTVINGNLFTRGNMSGSSLRVDGYADLWGNLSVSGAVVFDGAATFGSTLDLNGVTYTFPASDGVSSGWVLKTDSSGTLSWAPDTDTDTNTQSSTGALQTVFDNRYVRTAGDTMTGDLVLQSADLIASGATITSNLAASGSLSIDGLAYLNSNTAITGVLAVTSNISGSGTFSIEGASSLQGAVTLGSTLRINSVTYT